jgi:hypothetical protein
MASLHEDIIKGLFARRDRIRQHVARLMAICYEDLTIKTKDMLNLLSPWLKNADQYVTRWLIRFKCLGIIIKWKLYRSIHWGRSGKDIFFLNFNQDPCHPSVPFSTLWFMKESDQTRSHSRRDSTRSLIMDLHCYRSQESLANRGFPLASGFAKRIICSYSYVFFILLRADKGK